MLSTFAKNVLSQIELNGYEINIIKHRGVPVISVYDADRNAETCIGVTPDQQREVFTRLALDYCSDDQRMRLVPSRHPQDLLLASA